MGRWRRGLSGAGRVEGCPLVASPRSAVPATVSVASTPPSPSHRRHRLVSLARPHTRLPDSLLAATPSRLTSGARGSSFTDGHDTRAVAPTRLTGIVQPHDSEDILYSATREDAGLSGREGGSPVKSSSRWWWLAASAAAGVSVIGVPEKYWHECNGAYNYQYYDHYFMNPVQVKS